MDTFMCSSWYNYAYVTPYWKKGEKLSPDDTPWDPEKGRYWLPQDQYTGGIEHATMHLLYTRFFTKAMRDMGLVDFDEPMLRLYNQGIILGEDGFKMSKSRGNVVSPDEVIAQYGADSVRAYLMFIGPWDEGGPWNRQGIEGVWRFLNQVWYLVLEEPREDIPAGFDLERAERDLRRITHQTIRDVTERIESFRFNTMLSKMMEFNNYLAKAKGTPIYGTEAWDEAIRTLILMLAPSCPHIAEEMWTRIGGEYSVHQQAWPEWSEELAADEVITLVVQVNGKVRDRLEVPVGISEERAKEMALDSPSAQRHTAGKEVVKVIYVQGRLVNIVVK
jgi:leucyl-tRNA synthetase